MLFYVALADRCNSNYSRISNMRSSLFVCDSFLPNFYFILLPQQVNIPSQTSHVGRQILVTKLCSRQEPNLDCRTRSSYFPTYLRNNLNILIIIQDRHILISIPFHTAYVKNPGTTRTGQLMKIFRTVRLQLKLNIKKFWYAWYKREVVMNNNSCLLMLFH